MLTLPGWCLFKCSVGLESMEILQICNRWIKSRDSITTDINETANAKIQIQIQRTFNLNTLQRLRRYWRAVIFFRKARVLLSPVQLTKWCKTERFQRTQAKLKSGKRHTKTKLNICICELNVCICGNTNTKLNICKYKAKYLYLWEYKYKAIYLYLWYKAVQDVGYDVCWQNWRESENEEEEENRWTF